MSDCDEARFLLRNALDDPNANFRDGQCEAIDAVVNHRARLLVVQRTGWGKSSVYFIATRILRNRGQGPTLIISPLLALMRNQIEAAARYGVTALSINSTNQSDWPELVEAILSDQADALLISPERLSNDSFVTNVLMPIAGRIGLLVVDEAHCISDWGHDFRPDYRRLVNVLQQIPQGVPILCTTATANDRVVTDIVDQLGNIAVQRGPLTRSKLALQTLVLPTQAERLAWLAECMGTLRGTGIIYTLTKRDADQVADWLSQRGHSAKAYYSGVIADGFQSSDDYRIHLEDLLLNNGVKAIVATSSLGMGFDKPDLGFVIHYQAPGSIVAYYQQVGRAGRAIDNAVGILMSGAEDARIHEYFRRTAFPEEAWVLEVLRVLNESEDGLSQRELEKRINLRSGQIDQVLKYLSVENPAPVIRIDGRWRRTANIYEMDNEKIQYLTNQRENEWREVQSYTGETGCLMSFLAKALDDPGAGSCGICSSCLGRPIINPDVSIDAASRAAHFLKQAELVLETKIQVAHGAFEQYGFHGTLPVSLRPQPGRMLSRWGDAGWGQIVAADKHAGRFRDELVAAVSEMITERWKPEPKPAWVCSIPSTRHPDLVPDFAERLARALSLRFAPVLTKVRENQPQKHQQNRYHQCRNLDGVFAVSEEVPDGGVFLIDDVVDSGWTMTIATALLRRAGSGQVFPIALASSDVGN